MNSKYFYLTIILAYLFCWAHLFGQQSVDSENVIYIDTDSINISVLTDNMDLRLSPLNNDNAELGAFNNTFVVSLDINKLSYSNSLLLKINRTKLLNNYDNIFMIESDKSIFAPNYINLIPYYGIKSHDDVMICFDIAESVLLKDFNFHINFSDLGGKNIIIKYNPKKNQIP